MLSTTGSGEGWASEDEEIITEIREVWRMSAVSYTVAEDSYDSQDAEEVAQIKVNDRPHESVLWELW